MNVGMAASGDFPVAAAARGILRVLVGLPPNTKILLRRGLHSEPGVFETLVAQLCDSLGIEYAWRRPEPGGRGATFRRDVSLIGAADGVIVFFHPDRIMEGGTGHLVEKAIDANVPVWAFTYNEGIIDRVGEVEAPEGSPAEVLTKLTQSV